MKGNKGISFGISEDGFYTDVEGFTGIIILPRPTLITTVTTFLHKDPHIDFNV